MRLGRRHALILGAALALPAGRRAARAEGAPARPAALPRLLAFGDSLTAGFGLPPHQGLVPRLGAWLAAAGQPADILNGGLSGETTEGGLTRIGWALLRGPDAVMVELGGNDMLIGVSPKRAEANLDRILTRAGAGGRPLLLVGVQAPARLDTAAWAAIWPRLAARHDALLVPDLYAPIAALPPEDRSRMLQPDGVHPSEPGVRLIVEALGPEVLRLLGRATPDAARP